MKKNHKLSTSLVYYMSDMSSLEPSTSKPDDSVNCSNEEVSKTDELCIAKGCKNMAVSHLEWDNEYCSVNCCYKHCEATFKAWLEDNKAAKIMSESNQEMSTTSISNQQQDDPITTK